MGNWDGVINGKWYYLRLDSTALALTQNLSFNVTNDTLDITCRETDSWSTKLPSTRSWEITAEGVVAFRTNAGASMSALTIDEVINTYWINRNDMLVQIIPGDSNAGTIQAGVELWEGRGNLTAIEASAPMEDNVTFSLTIAGKSDLHQTVW